MEEEEDDDTDHISITFINFHTIVASWIQFFAYHPRARFGSR